MEQRKFSRKFATHHRTQSSWRQGYKRDRTVPSRLFFLICVPVPQNPVPFTSLVEVIKKRLKYWDKKRTRRLSTRQLNKQSFPVIDDELSEQDSCICKFCQNFAFDVWPRFRIFWAKLWRLIEIFNFAFRPKFRIFNFEQEVDF